jgi:hypothetical protein
MHLVAIGIIGFAVTVAPVQQTLARLQSRGQYEFRAGNL